jgi:hypothetical protein
MYIVCIWLYVNENILGRRITITETAVTMDTNNSNFLFIVAKRFLNPKVMGMENYFTLI